MSSMVSDQNHILYAGFAKGTTILAELCKEPGLEAVAKLCIEKTPPNHSTFSHTARNKTYTFLIGDRFIYFAVFNEDLDKSEGLGFLHRISRALDELIRTRTIQIEDANSLDFDCYQQHFDSILQQILSPERKPEEFPEIGSMNGRSFKESGPLLEVSSQGTVMKEKTVMSSMETNGDVNTVLSRDLPVVVTVGKGSVTVADRQSIKQVWKKYVWVALALDLFVCAVMFGIWLCFCRGFTCIKRLN